MNQIKIGIPRVTNQYHIIGKVQNRIALIIVDTGACLSHISPKLAGPLYPLEEPITYNTFFGESVTLDKSTKVQVTLTPELVIESEFLIDNTSVSSEILLGNNFLDEFQYSITNDYLILRKNDKQFVIPRINLSCHKIRKILDG